VVRNKAHHLPDNTTTPTNKPNRYEHRHLLDMPSYSLLAMFRLNKVGHKHGNKYKQQSNYWVDMEDEGLRKDYKHLMDLVKGRVECSVFQMD
jgi:hypothetical protein